MTIKEMVGLGALRLEGKKMNGLERRTGKETGEKEGNRDGKKEQMGLGEGKVKGLEKRTRKGVGEEYGNWVPVISFPVIHDLNRCFGNYLKGQ